MSREKYMRGVPIELATAMISEDRAKNNQDKEYENYVLLVPFNDYTGYKSRIQQFVCTTKAILSGVSINPKDYNSKISEQGIDISLAQLFRRLGSLQERILNCRSFREGEVIEMFDVDPIAKELESMRNEFLNEQKYREQEANKCK